MSSLSPLEAAAGRAFLLARAAAVSAPARCDPAIFRHWRLAEKLLASLLEQRACPIQVDSHVIARECDGSLEVVRIGCPHRPGLRSDSISGDIVKVQASPSNPRSSFRELPFGKAVRGGRQLTSPSSRDWDSLALKTQGWKFSERNLNSPPENLPEPESPRGAG